MVINQSLRIAIYHGLPAGGAKRSAFEQAKRLSERHTLCFFSLGSRDDGFGDVRPYAVEGQVLSFEPTPLFSWPFRRLNPLVRTIDLLRLRQASRRMAEEINQGDFDVVLVHHCHYARTPWLLQFLRRPVVYFCQEHNRALHEQSPDRPYTRRPGWKRLLDRLDPFYSGERWFLAQIEKRGLRDVDRILVNSEYIGNELRRIYGVDAFVNYHGVDVESFPALSLSRENMVLSVGALTPLKGFGLIIEGLARLPAATRPRLVLVSNYQNPDERLFLESLANRLGVEVSFLAMVDHQSLVDLYNRALMTVYTPVKEPFGLVPLESMACGTPVIGVAEGGVKETIRDGVTGRLVARDPDVLAAAIAELLADPALRTRIGQAGREYVEREWVWERAVSQLERHLYEVART